ncbi:hypothetical protein SRHO_G00131310 [Serrasalmus rhombeus]
MREKTTGRSQSSVHLLNYNKEQKHSSRKTLAYPEKLQYSSQGEQPSLFSVTLLQRSSIRSHLQSSQGSQAMSS